jgi:hypothetical protein
MIKCQICEKKLQNIKSLGVHIKTHGISYKEYNLKYFSDNLGLCMICGKIYKTLRGLGSHVTHAHDISAIDYYIKYKGVKNYCYCGKETPYLDFKRGFQKHCSAKCAGNSEDVKNKRENTCLELYNTKSVSQNEVVKEKTKQTCLQIYEQETSFNYETIKKIIKNKYGCDNISQVEEIKTKVKNTNFDKIFHNLKFGNRLKNKVIPLFTREEYIGTKDDEGKGIKYKFQCTTCDNVFEDYLHNGKIPRCLVCYPIDTGTSKLEKNILSEFKNIIYAKYGETIEILENDRSVLAPFEIDILIPQLKISIEVNGKYWHSSKKAIKRDAWKAETLITKGFKHIIIKETDWNSSKQSILQKFDRLLELDFETYSTTRSIFTGF